MMNEEHSRMAMSEIAHAAMMCQHSIQQAVCDYGLPSAIYRPRVFKDGNMWCALYGVDLQDGVSGFGDTPAAAVADFNACWNGWGKYKVTANG